MHELDNQIRQKPDLLTPEELFKPRPRVVLWGGNKKLEVRLWISQGEAHTYIHNLSRGRHLMGMTTRLYEIAGEVIQLAANLSGETLIYGFQSQNPTMINWAKDPEKGGRVFNWDHIDDNREVFWAHRTYYPSEGNAFETRRV